MVNRRNWTAIGILIFLAVFIRCTPPAQAPKPQTTIVFLTDFSTKDPAVAICKGVMLSIYPQARIIDLSHDVPPFDIGMAGEFLASTTRHYPKGTVFVVVVDPGVGGKRKSIAVSTKRGHFLVGPDNGVFTKTLIQDGLDLVVELTNKAYFRFENVSSTFHGRDIFSAVGAHIAAGVAIQKIGTLLDHVEKLSISKATFVNGIILGEVSYVEKPFGNIVTNIPKNFLPKADIQFGDKLTVKFDKSQMVLPFHKTFSDVTQGSPLALIHSKDYLSFSINMGNFADIYSITPHQKVEISTQKKESVSKTN